jgi:hypothetical protein
MKIRYTIFFLMIGFVIWKFATSSMLAQQGPADTGEVIKITRIDPNEVNVNQETIVTVETRITFSEALLGESVNLLRYNEKGEFKESFGKMYDDGTHGDSIKSDNVFTTQIKIKESQPLAIFLKSSVAFRGAAQRKISEEAIIYVKSTDPPDRTLLKIADNLNAGNIEATIDSFNSSAKNRKALSRLNAHARTSLAAAFRNARPIESSDEIKRYESSWALAPGRVYAMKIVMGRDKLGRWGVINW